MGNRRNVIVMGLTALALIWSVVAFSIDLPTWTVAVVWVLVGMFWAFGSRVSPGGSDAFGAPRQRNRNRNRG